MEVFFKLKTSSNYKRSDSPEFFDVPTSVKNILDATVSNDKQSEDISADGTSTKAPNVGTVPAIKTPDVLKENDPELDETVELNFQGGPTSDIDINNNTKSKESANMDNTVDLDKGYESAETVQLEVSNDDNLLQGPNKPNKPQKCPRITPKKGLSLKWQMKSKSRKGGLTSVMVLMKNAPTLKLSTKGGRVQMSRKVFNMHPTFHLE